MYLGNQENCLKVHLKSKAICSTQYTIIPSLALQRLDFAYRVIEPEVLCSDKDHRVSKFENHSPLVPFCSGNAVSQTYLPLGGR